MDKSLVLWKVSSSHSLGQEQNTCADERTSGRVDSSWLKRAAAKGASGTPKDKHTPGRKGIIHNVVE